MRSNDYHFVSRWCFQARIEEVAAILEEIESLPDWWPMVYLQVRILDPGANNGIGRKVDLLTKGRLPYQLRWQFTVVDNNNPYGFTIEAEGDFVGRGVWRLVQNGPLAEVEFDWRIRAEKPILKSMSWAMKPVFEWNHRWAMDQGQECLCAEIKRRRRTANKLDLAAAAR
ncbi:MAG TPA: SRPBCC family protein [Fimbriimonas sp.]|nr:SRPBCC family protein [Fimbriimonas sp.]